MEEKEIGPEEEKALIADIIKDVKEGTGKYKWQECPNGDILIEVREGVSFMISAKDRGL